MEIGDIIKKEREKLGYTQNQLAIKAKLTPAAISQYESNQRTPSIEAVQKIAEALGVTIALLTGENTTTNNKNFNENQDVYFRRYNNLDKNDKESVDKFIDFLNSKGNAKK